MDISTAMDRLIVVQAAISITTPEVLSVKRVYRLFPKQDALLPDCPCVANSWTFVGEERSASQRIQHYTVHMQLFVDNSDQDRGAAIATAFHVALINAFHAPGNTQLTDTPGTAGGASSVTGSTLRGGTPTLARLEFGGKAYVGLDLFLDLTMKEPWTWIP